MRTVATNDEVESEAVVRRVCLVPMSLRRSAKFIREAPVAGKSIREPFLRPVFFRFGVHESSVRFC